MHDEVLATGGRAGGALAAYGICRVRESECSARKRSEITLFLGSAWLLIFCLVEWLTAMPSRVRRL